MPRPPLVVTPELLKTFVTIVRVDGTTALAVVRNRADTGWPVPSPQLNFAPLAVVKFIAPRRMNCCRK